ncbi:unnamed protein product, partial [Heterosigma akashiwo]
ASSFWLTRIVFTRWLTFVYAFAFLASIKQNRQLLGNKGILPARNYLEFRATGSCKGTQPKKISKSLFAGLPTLFWFVNWDFMDLFLDLVAGAGLLLSTATFMLGTSNMLVMALLWSLYLSIVNIGQTWFAYGWESQLLETGFLAIFLYPALKLAALNSSTPVPWVCIWGFRWLLFRVMLGSGLIKLRGDPCWRDLTAMHYHYETQPIPNPFSYWLHKLPGWYHRFETFMNHVMEVAVPWLLLAPIRALFLPAGLLQIVFQFLWIAALGPLYRSPWVVALAKRLLSPGHDRPWGAGALFAVNPFAGGPPPECLRAVRYRYRFS